MMHKIQSRIQVIIRSVLRDFQWLGTLMECFKDKKTIGFEGHLALRCSKGSDHVIQCNPKIIKRASKSKIVWYKHLLKCDYHSFKANSSIIEVTWCMWLILVLESIDLHIHTITGGQWVAPEMVLLTNKWFFMAQPVSWVTLEGHCGADG